MTSNLKRLKSISLNLADNVFETLKNSKPADAASYILNAVQDVSEYFSSAEYEEDLDQVIDLLHIFNSSQRPQFTEYKTKKKRLKAKAKYVRQHTLLFMIAAATTGYEIGSYILNPQVGLIIGTAAGVIIVSFVAGRIIIDRISPTELQMPPRTV